MVLYRIEEVFRHSERVFQMWIHAPQVARHAAAGQFLVLRLDDRGERIPLTISAVRGDLVRVIFMTVGKTTTRLSMQRAGDDVRDVVGPLGKPTDLQLYGTCAVIGGGVGIAGAPIIARALRGKGNRVIGILGARSAPFMILEEEMREACDEVLVATDDGTLGRKGFAADLLREVLSREHLDAAWIIGPAIMMKVTSEVTRPQGIRTFVSLNPIMVDGTGMCGSCRVMVGGKTRFACVDGPEFDAHQVDFDGLMARQRMYLGEEKRAMEEPRAGPCGGRG
ncbi:MAG: sulfide/dihydroorotate dehydrogenase-like FAD/NAD-binding protein [Methanomicrobiales archaeon]|nr:sulfide/dihydroorotate dehydrogenase-like FAD/NAD-binding protein [Methanomicrobiales archaeon]